MYVDLQTPAPRPWGVSDDEAVGLCREWMRCLGAVDAVAASGDAQARCDLYSSNCLGWVENARGNLDAGTVERAAQLSAADGRIALIFVSGGVLPDARQRADALGIALLRFRAHDGALEGANAYGRRLRVEGL